MEIEREEYEVYLRNDPYYLEEWDSIKEGNSPRFNIYAFLFGFFWLLYRKMYLVLLMVFGALVLLAIAEESLVAAFNIPKETASMAANILNLIIAAVLGKYANKLYLFNATKKITAIRQRNLPEESYYTAVYQVGGTTLIPFIIILSGLAGAMLYFSFVNN